MFTRRAKSTRIIGDPENQRPDKWNCTEKDQWENKERDGSTSSGGTNDAS